VGRQVNIEETCNVIDYVFGIIHYIMEQYPILVHKKLKK